MYTMAETLKVFSSALAVCLALASFAAEARGPVMAPSPFLEGPTTSQGPAGAPLPGLDCTNSLFNMSSCLTYVEQGSNVTVPDKGCCPALASMVDNQPYCLCQLLASGEIFGMKIDTTKALMMPTACKVDAPSVSLCSLLGIPVASPTAPSPSPSSGGPEKPGSGAVHGSPLAAAPPINTGSTGSRATGLAALITILIAVAII